MIRVVNKKDWYGDGTYIGRPSPLGNPYSHISSSQPTVKVASREEAVEKYREWLLEQLDSHNPASAMFLRLVDEYIQNGDLTLICWCKPLSPCHGDIISDFILQCVAGLSVGEKT